MVNDSHAQQLNKFDQTILIFVNNLSLWTY